MNLQDIIDMDEDQAPLWIAYPNSITFQVLVRPLGNKQKEFLEKSREVKWNEAVMEQEVVFNEEKYIKLFSAHVIVDWKGLDVDVIKKLVLIKNFKKLRDVTGGIACDDTAKALLMKHSPAFSIWINRVCVDIERFNQEREEVEKKTS